MAGPEVVRRSTRCARADYRPRRGRDRDRICCARQAYVDGRWIDADSGATFPVVNPATGETIAEVPRLGAAETRRAIEAAAAGAAGVEGAARRRTGHGSCGGSPT